MNRLIAISGCSSGGKSTLIDALSGRGYRAVEEPGRRIIAEAQILGGEALPWVNPEAFARRAVEMSQRDIREHQGSTEWVFFDRGLVDAASGLSELSGVPVSDYIGNGETYFERVFLAPPWAEIYVNDADRRHSLSQAVQEYERLLALYSALGFDVVLLPKIGVEERADFVLQQIGE